MVNMRPICSSGDLHSCELTSEFSQIWTQLIDLIALRKVDDISQFVTGKVNKCADYLEAVKAFIQDQITKMDVPLKVQEVVTTQTNGPRYIWFTGLNAALEAVNSQMH